MDSATVVEVLDALAAEGVDVWLDGGWGVDALVGNVTRAHSDLDLAVWRADLGLVCGVLVTLGFVLTDDELPARAVYRRPDGTTVDLHPLVPGSDGAGLQELQDGSFGTYTAQGLSGHGTVGDRPVRCLSPELQVAFHLGFEPDDDDRHDVRMLCQRFALPVPAQYL